MRRLIQPEVSKSAAVAALVCAVLCCPRLVLWEHRTLPVWYLETAVFCASFVMWAFVFAWHTHYTGRPVFTLRFQRKDWALGTVAAFLAGLILYLFFDPALRRTTPDDYPLNLAQWIGATLFTLALNQLFLIFAPFAWAMRLCRRQAVAVVFTIVFGVAVLFLKAHSSPEPFPTSLLAALIGVRVALGVLAVGFYLRGGVLLASWCALLVQSRHLLRLVFE